MFVSCLTWTLSYMRAGREQLQVTVGFWENISLIYVKPSKWQNECCLIFFTCSRGNKDSLSDFILCLVSSFFIWPPVTSLKQNDISDWNTDKSSEQKSVLSALKKTVWCGRLSDHRLRTTLTSVGRYKNITAPRRGTLLPAVQRRQSRDRAALSHRMYQHSGHSNEIFLQIHKQTSWTWPRSQFKDITNPVGPQRELQVSSRTSSAATLWGSLSAV